MFLNQFTVTQMIVAAGLSRKLQRREICRMANCNISYITRLLRNDNFHQLVTLFESLPFDGDSKIYNGIGTLYLDIGRLTYSEGEKIIRNAKQT